MTDPPSADDYRGKSRNPQWERELRNLLRQQPEDTRLEFLMDLVNHHEVVALLLAHKVLESRNSYVQLLEFAVANRNASSIKYWLRAVVPRLGFRRTVDHLLRMSTSHDSGVAKALYWLPQHAKSDSDQIKLRELTEAVSSQAAIPPGSAAQTITAAKRLLRQHEVAEQARELEGIQQGLEDVGTGRTQRLAEAFGDIRRDLELPPCSGENTAPGQPQPPGRV